jgi:hypothetical protein
VVDHRAGDVDARHQLVAILGLAGVFRGTGTPLIWCTSSGLVVAK